MNYGFSFGVLKNAQGQVVQQGSSRIGDNLIWSALPQMLFEQRGIQVVDMDKHWMFDNNPFVKRDIQVDKVIPCQLMKDKSTFNNYLRNLSNFLSVVDHLCTFFGLESTIRHPKLYKFEDVERKPNKVILVTQGNNQGQMNGESDDRVLSDEILDTIKTNYKNYDIVQIGSKNDKDAGVTDKRGLPIWESVKEIAESSLYIGVNTGPLWIASAYPHINKKVILTQYNDNFLKYYIPMSVNDHHNIWNDWGVGFYNTTDKDIGTTYSYKKI